MDGDSRSRRMQISVKKLEHSREYKRLKLQEEFLEKNLAAAIRSMKTDGDSIREIAEEKVRASAQRRSTTGEMGSPILGVVKELKWLKSTVQGAAPSALKNLDVSDCGSRLRRLSNRIEDLKLQGKSRLNVLTREEESLDSDLVEFERYVFADRTQPLGNSNTALERKCPSRSEVNDQFTELVARTGHTQGWSDDDHSLFLRARKNGDSIPRLVTELRKRRPNFTNEYVVNHEAWYKLYADLREKRKREIAEWRSRNGKGNGNGKGDGGVPHVPEKGIDEDTTTKKKKKRKKKPGSKGETDKEEDKNDKKKMIEDWRAERLRKSAMDDEQRERLERAKKAEENRRRDTKRREAMIKLRNYREKKAADQRGSSTLETSLKPGKQTSRDSRRLMKSFREEDEKFVRKRLSLLNLAAEKIADNHDSKSAAGRNSTLFKPTKVWEEKCKRDLNAPVDLPFGKVNYVKDIPRLSSSSSAPPRESNRNNRT